MSVPSPNAGINYREIVEFLKKLISEQTGVPGSKIPAATNLTSYGIDSVGVVRAARKLSEFLGVPEETGAEEVRFDAPHLIATSHHSAIIFNWKGLIMGPWKEANALVLTLNMDDKNVNGEAMEIALAYLYGHYPKLNDSDAFRMLAAASKLNRELKEKIQNGSIEKKLDSQLSVTFSERETLPPSALKETPLKLSLSQNPKSMVAVDTSVAVPPRKETRSDHSAMDIDSGIHKGEFLQSGKYQTSCRTSGFCALCAIQKHVSRALQATGRILEPMDLVSNLLFDLHWT